MKYSVLILMAGCCRLSAANYFGNSYSAPFIDHAVLTQTSPQYTPDRKSGAQQFYPSNVYDHAVLTQMLPQTTSDILRNKNDPRHVCFSEVQAPININGGDYFYDDFNYKNEQDLQNRQKNLLNVRLLLQNSKRNYSFENGRLFRFTKQGKEEINTLSVIGTQRTYLLNGEGCFYDQEVLKFIICSSNEDMRELDKIVPEGDFYNMFVFDKNTARYFYVQRNENNLPIGLIPLELVHKTKDENGQESSFLKIIDNVYEVCDGKMRYIGAYRAVESDCYIDTYGKVWQKDLYQGFNNYNSQQNQIMRVADNYSQNINVTNGINYVNQYPNSNLNQIMQLVENYSDNINSPSQVPQRIKVTGVAVPNRLQSSLVCPTSNSKVSNLPFQSARR